MRRLSGVLLIPVTVLPSPIHGLGAFAKTGVRAGTPVWRFSPGLDLDADPALVERQPADLRRVLLHYGYIDRRLRRFILCCDDARFINHSDLPNLVPEYGADRYGIDIAIRDIASGEELTVDYGVLEGFRAMA